MIKSTLKRALILSCTFFSFKKSLKIDSQVVLFRIKKQKANFTKMAAAVINVTYLDWNSDCPKFSLPLILDSNLIKEVFIKKKKSPKKYKRWVIEITQQNHASIFFEN